MTKKAPRPKYSSRFWLNLALGIVVASAAWVWFNIHLKPHVDARLFGGVSLATLILFAYGIFKSFTGDEAKNAVQQAIKKPATTWGLVVAIPVIVVAYLTTVSVYLVAAKTPEDGKPMVFRVTCPGCKVRTVELTKSETEATLTFPFTRSVRLSIDTQSPRGYRRKDVTIAERYEELRLPDEASRKQRRLLRLVPGRDLIRLSNRPNNDYHLTVYRNDQPLFDQTFMKFEALYVGAALEDFKDDVPTLNADTVFIRQLREYLRNIGATEDDAALQPLVERYINHHRAVGTSELQDNDHVRVVLRAVSAAVTPVDQTFTITPGQQIQTVFLKGVSR